MAWLYTLVALVAAFAFAQPALADDGGPGGLGSGNQTYIPSAQAQQFMQEKQHLADEHSLMIQGKLSTLTYQQDLQAFYQKHNIKHGSAKATPFSAKQSSLISPETSYSSNLLGVNQIAQAKTYYCGPGSAEMILAYLGYATPQTTLANSSYLQTEEYGGTNYGSNVMAPTLNTLGHTYGFYAQTNVSSVGTYENDLGMDIDGGWPLTNAVHESDTYNLVSAESGWYHWYVVRGYENWGGTADYADPASGIWHVPAYGTVGAGTAVGMMNGFGYVW